MSDGPTLQTERLVLRRWRDSDQEPFARLNADPEVMRYFRSTLDRAGSDAMIDRIEAGFAERGYGLWAVEVNGAFVGFTGLILQTFEAAFTPAVEVGWRFAREAWGHGYATEAATAALDFAFGPLGLADVVSLTTVTNERSQAVMRRLGLTRDPAEDFEFPSLPEGHPLRPTVVYRTDRERWARHSRLERRLRAASVPRGLEPVESWRVLRAAEGPAATVLDLYDLEAARRGIAAHQLPRADRYGLGREVMPDVWPGFDTTHGSDRPNDVIALAEYDPQWPVRYERWRAAVQDALGQTAVRIEHVGSTSVPGLAAKPIVDLQVGVRDLDAEDDYVPQLEALGVQLRSRDVLHRYFRPFPDRPRDVHVHVCVADSEWEREHLLFRDHLRRHPDARERYLAAKRRAAELWSDDGFAYTDAKSEVILELLAQVRNG